MKNRSAIQFLRSVMSLALLPAKQIRAVHKELLQYLDYNKVAYSDQCREFMQYVQRTWMDGAFQPEEWSVYRKEKSTINDLKGECAISCCSPATIHKKNYWHESKNSKTGITLCNKLIYTWTASWTDFQSSGSSQRNTMLAVPRALASVQTFHPWVRPHQINVLVHKLVKIYWRYGGKLF